MRVVVTGAAGHVGSAVCRALATAGHEVVATDVTTSIRPLPVDLCIANLLDPATSYSLLERAGAVVHLANHPSEGKLQPPHRRQRTFIENVSMTMNVFQAAIECGVKKVVYASSIQAFVKYPNANTWDRAPGVPYLPLDSDVPANPSSGYALSKHAGEAMLSYAVQNSDIEGVALRFPLMLDAGRMKYYREKHFGGMLDEAFSYLMVDDAGSLVNAILRTSLPGLRVWFPAAPDNMLGLQARQVLDRYYPNMPLKKPIAQITSLVDMSAIQREVDWTPTAAVTNGL